jgi:hypothetical protein
MKPSVLRAPIFALAAALTLANTSLAQKVVRSDIAARQELDSFTAQGRSSTPGGKTTFGDSNGSAALGDKKSIQAEPVHASVAQGKWAHFKQQAGHVALTAARVAASSGYVPMVPRLWPPVSSQGAPVNAVPVSPIVDPNSATFGGNIRPQGDPNSPNSGRDLGGDSSAAALGR